MTVSSRALLGADLETTELRRQAALDIRGGLKGSLQHLSRAAHGYARSEGGVVVYVRLSEAEKNEIWTPLGAGESFRMIARKLGRSSATVRDYMATTGGVRPGVRTRRGSYLSASEGGDLPRAGRRTVVSRDRQAYAALAFHDV